MKLLFDENLSHHLITTLGDLYPESEHVRNVGLKAGDDMQIWKHALDHDFVIATKDDDFRSLSVLRGHPPKVILLALGNCSTPLVEQLLREHHERLMRFAHDEYDSHIIISM